MRNRAKCTLIGAVLLLLMGCRAALPNPEPMELAGAKNLTAAGDVFVAGTLDMEAIDALKERGAKAMIDLREPEQIPEWYAEAVSAHGITYVNVPMRSDGMSSEDALRVEKALGDLPSKNLIIACGSANRAGAAYAMYAAKRYHCTVGEALEIGRKTGLRNEQLAADLQNQMEAGEEH